MSKRKLLRTITVISCAALLCMIGYFVIFTGEEWDQVTVSYGSDTVPYALYSPDRIIELPPSHREVSGVAYYGDQTLALVCDNRGTVSLLDCGSGKITEEYKFGKKADYEDIAIGNGKIYVIRSTGKIHRVKRLGSVKQAEKDFDTEMSSKNNAEGLCFDGERNALLVVCKGSDLYDPSNRRAGKTKAIYTFDLTLKKILPEPFVTIDLEQIGAVQLSLIVSKDLFQPSGIALHPASGHLYVISSVGRMLLVVDRKGTILSLVALPRTIFGQPEGICFAPNGDLFVSNEGRNGTANVLRFVQKK